MLSTVLNYLSHNTIKTYWVTACCDLVSKFQPIGSCITVMWRPHHVKDESTDFISDSLAQKWVKVLYEKSV